MYIHLHVYARTQQLTHTHELCTENHDFNVYAHAHMICMHIYMHAPCIYTRKSRLEAHNKDLIHTTIHAYEHAHSYMHTHTSFRSSVQKKQDWKHATRSWVTSSQMLWQTGKCVCTCTYDMYAHIHACTHVYT